MTIQDNIKASEAATDCFAFISAEWQNVPPRFYERLIELCKERLPKVAEQQQPITEMSYEAARLWCSRNSFPRGQFQNECVRDVPLWYVDYWLDNSQDKFTSELREWRKSQYARNLELNDEK